VYSQWFIHQPRGFIELLEFCRQHQVPHQRLLDTALYVNSICPGQVTGEKIMALLGNQSSPVSHVPQDNPVDEIEHFANRQLEEINGLINAKMEAVI
jgi:hypothetical protein